MLRKVEIVLRKLEIVSINGLDSKNYPAQVVALERALERYNHLRAELDAQTAHVKAQEKVVGDLNARALLAIAGAYGKDSPQYAQAGGRRTSERKRRGERKKELAARKSARQRREASVGGDSTGMANAASRAAASSALP